MKIKLKLILFLCIALLFHLIFVEKTEANFDLDLMFGSNGKVITQFGHEARPARVILQTDGKLIVVGFAENGDNLDWKISRYNTSGGLDSFFGDNGIVSKDFGSTAFGHSDFIQSVILQSDGKIVVGGSSATSANRGEWTLARYNQDGSLDANFGNNGIVITTLRNSSVVEYVNAILLQPDNKIIAVGVSHTGNTDLALARYNTDGSLDTSFGTGGTVTEPIGGNNDRGNAAVLQADGKIVVLGDFDAGGHDNIFLTRHNVDGTLDTSFGSNGKVITQMGGYDGARAIALQPDGNILVTGGTNNGGTDTYLARYNSDGSLDNTFGSGGKVIQSFSSGDDSSNTIKLQSDGKILLGGMQHTQGTIGVDFALRRFNTNGSLDTSFGNNGSIVTVMSSVNDSIRDIALQADGKIVAAGEVHNGSYNDWGLARYSEQTGGNINRIFPILRYEI